MKKLAKMLLCLLMMGTTNSPMNLSAENENKDDKYYKDGELATSTWVEVKDKWYFTNSEGEAIKNKWIASGKNWFHLKEDGTMSANEWYATSGNRWYYLDEEGKMADFPLFIDGKLQGFNEDGTWQKHEVKVKGVPVSVVGNYERENVEFYLQQLKALPTALVSSPTEYIFTDEFGTGIIVRAGQTMLSYDYDGPTIEWVKLNSFTKSNTTLLHELVHGVDHLYGLSKTQEFENALSGEKKSVTLLGAENNLEYFAEMTTGYFENPEVAMSKYPQCASYIKQVFESQGIVIPSSYFEVEFKGDKSLIVE